MSARSTRSAELTAVSTTKADRASRSDVTPTSFRSSRAFEREHILRINSPHSGGQSARRAIVAFTLVGTCVAVLSACTSAPTLHPCPESLSDALISQSDTFHVDRELEAADVSTSITDLGDAPPPSCAFLGTASGAGDTSPYAAVWVTDQASEADSISKQIASETEATGLPIASEVPGTDSVVNFMEVADDGTVTRVIVQTISSGSALIGLGAEEETHLVVLTSATTPPNS